MFAALLKTVCGGTLWNELHKDIKQSGNIAQYKNKCKRYKFDGFIYWGVWVYVYYEPIVVLLYRMRILMLVIFVYTQLIVFICMYTCICICTDTILVWRS